MADTRETGVRGEQAAVDFLRANGYTILATNWRSGKYEIDIVARRDDTVRFVEVKCRKVGGLTLPEEAIDARKVRALFRVVNDYISAHGLECECCIDVIAVDAMSDGSFSIRHIPDAVQPRW